MTHEERSKWINRAFLLLLAAGIVSGVWFYRDRLEEIRLPQASVVQPKHELEILHFHLPGQKDSEALADHLNHVEKKYCSQVLVTRLDVRSNAERVKKENVRYTPEVIILQGEATAFRFQGLWPKARIEERVEEILRGLRRMEEGWMPAGINRR